MLCENPYITRGGVAASCTRCYPCRFNKRRMWTNRMVLESGAHANSCFATFTYMDEFLPEGNSLDPQHMKACIKRLRDRIKPLKIRYFLVGEYGDLTNRPHYHAAIFGLPHTAHDIVQAAWGKGHVMLGELNKKSAQYIVGYTVKKMTSKDDPRLKGRHPEFARMSLKPGIGALSIADICDSLRHEGGIKYIIDHGDVPRTLMCEGKPMPIGRYMRQKIYQNLGLYDVETGELSKAPARAELLRLYLQEMRTLYPDAYDDKGYQIKPLKEVMLAVNKQKIMNFVKRTKIFQSEKTL